MEAADLTDEFKLRRTVAALHTKVFGDWDANGEWVPGVANFIEQMKADAKDAKEAAEAAATAARQNAIRGDTNRNWLIGTFVSTIIGVLLLSVQLYAIAHGAH